MKIKDKNGKEYEVRTDYCYGLSLISYIVENGMPIACTTFLPDGEVRAELRLPDFRNSKELTNDRISTIQEAMRQGYYMPTSGFTYGLVDPDNKVAVKYWENMGVHSEDVEVNGKKMKRFYNFAVEHVAGVVKA